MSHHDTIEPASGQALLPCPWCGSAPEIRVMHGGVGTIIECSDMACPIHCSVFRLEVDNPGESRTAVIAAWNCRQSSPDDGLRLIPSALLDSLVTRIGVMCDMLTRIAERRDVRLAEPNYGQGAK